MQQIVRHHSTPNLIMPADRVNMATRTQVLRPAIANTWGLMLHYRRQARHTSWPGYADAAATCAAVLGVLFSIRRYGS